MFLNIEEKTTMSEKNFWILGFSNYQDIDPNLGFYRLSNLIM
jgi:hypothetical protein